MKSTNAIARLIAIVMVFSCNKPKLDINGYPATLHVINAIAAYGSDVKIDFGQQEYIYLTGRSISYFNYDGKFTNGSATYGVPPGTLNASIAFADDTTKPIYNQSLNFSAGDNYSLFLTGYRNSPSALLVEEDFPVRTDTTTGIRFINLAPNSPPLSANIAGEPQGSLLSALSFKDISDFKSLPASADKNDYFIEVSDSNTGELLTGFFYYDLARLKNITLVIRGVVYGDPGLEVVRINNY